MVCCHFRCNVDMLKLIQLGMTFANERGETPKHVPATWQFHFKFDLKYLLLLSLYIVS